MTASKSRIAPGQTSIDRAGVRKDGNGYAIDWRIRLPDGRLLTKRSKGPTKGIARQRARDKAAELLRTQGRTTWKSTDLITDYIEQVSIPMIQGSARLRPRSKARYATVVNLLIEAFKTSQSTQGYTIAGGTQFRTLEAVLQEIAQNHGRENAHHARTILSKYVLQNLIRDGLITSNPLLNETIDLGLPMDDDDDKPRRGGHALTLQEYADVVQHLLQIVPEDGISKPKRGCYTLEDRVAKRRNTIDITLLQAATGLRVSEANAITWKDVTFQPNNQAMVHVSKSISKTHRMRDVPVLLPAVVQRLENRWAHRENDSDHVIGAPVDASKQWDAGNCGKATARLYMELADDLHIELLKTARTHVWRTTLNTMLLGSVPEIIRAAYFGHTQEINRDSYTDTTNMQPMLGAFNALFNQLTAS